MPPESDAPGNEPHLELPSLGFRRRKKRDKESGDEAVDPGPDSGASADAEQETHRAPVAPPPAARAPGAGDPPPARPAARPPARPAARPPSRPATPSAASAAARPKPSPARPPARPAAHPPAARPATPPAATPPSSPPIPGPADAETEPTTARPVEGEADTAVLGQMAAGLDEPRRGKRADRDKKRAARAEEQARVRQEKQEAKRAARQQRAELKAQRKQEQLEKREAARAARAELEEEPVGGEPVEDESPTAPLLDTAEGADGSADEGADVDRDDAVRFAPADALVARLPEIKPLYAAIISGLLAGLAAVLLAIGASQGCEAVRDNSSCGGGAGLLAIVAILAIEVLVGANLLKAWQISDPFSTSFLGVGVVATIAMLTFLDSLDSPWMLLVIPLMTAVAFALSWWVTVKFIDEHPMTSEIDAERGEPAFHEHPADQDEDSNA